MENNFCSEFYDVLYQLRRFNYLLLVNIVNNRVNY